MSSLLFLKKVYWHFFKTMPCEMILKTKWDKYRKVEKCYWQNHFDTVSMNVKCPNVITNKNIFVYWDKGFDKAPDIVKVCYERILKNIPEGWKLVTLSDDNVSEYIKMPTFIEKMLRGGKSTKLTIPIFLGLRCCIFMVEYGLIPHVF